MRRSSKLAVLSLLVEVGCTPKYKALAERQACMDEVTQERAQFIVKCSEAANPKSDEEGEDLVEQCEQTAWNVYPDTTCPVVFYSIQVSLEGYEQRYSRVRCDSSDAPARVQACHEGGYKP